MVWYVFLLICLYGKIECKFSAKRPTVFVLPCSLRKKYIFLFYKVNYESLELSSIFGIPNLPFGIPNRFQILNLDGFHSQHQLFSFCKMLSNFREAIAVIKRGINLFLNY